MIKNIIQTPTAHPTSKTMLPSGGTFLYLLRPQINKAKRNKRAKLQKINLTWNHGNLMFFNF